MKYRDVYSIIIVVVVFISMGYAANMKKANLMPCQGIIGDEPLQSNAPIPYLDGRQPPGVQIGITTYDYQANGGFGQRLRLDDNGNVHVDWMWCGGAYPGTPRYCGWNFRFTDGTWYGETQGSPSVSGYVQLDVVRDANPDNQVTAIAYHYDAGGGYFGWVDTDAGQGWGLWPNNMVTPAVADHIWPYIAIANNNNYVMFTHGQPVPGDNHVFGHYSTDLGTNWTTFFSVDSCAAISHFVRSSHNAGSQKVVACWNKFISDTVASGQIDNNVWYILSTDGGVSWGPRVNLTNYQPYPTDSIRAYTDVNAVFDANDDLHIAWSGRRVTTDYWVASKIFHWCEATGVVSVVNSPSIYYVDPGNWWIATTASADPGGWRMPADQPQLVVDETTGYLYCLWHGNDDYNDGSAAGYFNGEFYGSRSTDNGITWMNYVNLTNTHTPGGGSGACDDEDYMTAHPAVVNDSIYITYVEDKDSGGMPQTEGVLTTNPVRVWVFHKDRISPGVAEQTSEKPQITGLSLFPNPAISYSTVSYSVAQPGNVAIDLYDAAGRLIAKLTTGYREAGIYTANINVDKLANGTYFVVLETPMEAITNSLVIMH